MNRRDFLKTAGFAAASLPICQSVFGADGSEESGMSKEQLLEQADRRIREYRKAKAVLKLVGPEAKNFYPGLTVKVEQASHKFLFGSNIFRLHRCGSPQANTSYEKHFAQLLNFATLPFYWARYEAEKGKPDDARTREIVKWCKENNIIPKGHPLSWNISEPKWLPKSPEKAMQVQLERIRQCIERFKGDIDIWDVVNEATHYNRDDFLENAPILSGAIAKMGVGEYVRSAFKTARQANPDATLIINDYRVDDEFEKRVISQLVDEDRQPLYDVIGIQSHMHNGYWGIEKAWNICEKFAKFGKPLHFTELTILSGKLKDANDTDWRTRRKDWPSTEEGEKQQAKQICEFYTLLFSHPAVEAITVWDFADYNSWQGAPSGYLREDLTPKPVYNQLKELIKGKWWTNTKAIITTDGTASFRGFLGQYKITTTVKGRKLIGSFRLDKDLKETIEVRLTGV